MLLFFYPAVEGDVMKIFHKYLSHDAEFPIGIDQVLRENIVGGCEIGVYIDICLSFMLIVLLKLSSKIICSCFLCNKYLLQEITGKKIRK